MSLSNVGADIHADVPRLAYSMREAAVSVALCERSIWQAIKDGKLKAAKIGRSVRIHRDELDRFIRESQVVSGGPLRHRAAPEAGRESPGHRAAQTGAEAAPASLPAAARRNRT